MSRFFGAAAGPYGGRNLGGGSFTGGGDFSPGRVAGIQAWFKADAITGLANGAAVPQWDDSSGNARHATQATAGNRPIYQTSVVNGKPVVRFTAASSHWMTFPYALPIPGPFTAFAVVKSDGAANRTFLSTRVSGATAGRVFRINAAAWTMTNIGGNAVTSGAVTTTNFNLLACVYTSNTDADVITNGTKVEGNPTTSGTGLLNATHMSGEDTGADDIPNQNFLNGDIAEIIVYNVALSAATVDQIEAYFATKYGVTIA